MCTTVDKRSYNVKSHWVAILHLNRDWNHWCIFILCWQPFISVQSPRNLLELYSCTPKAHFKVRSGRLSKWCCPKCLLVLRTIAIDNWGIAIKKLLTPGDKVCGRLHILIWSYSNLLDTSYFLTGNLLPLDFKVSLHVILINHSEKKGYQNGAPGVLLLQIIPFFQRGTLFSFSTTCSLASVV